MSQSDADPQVRQLLVVSDGDSEPTGWPPGTRVVSALEYLTGSAAARSGPAQVLNLSTATAYQEAGYYVSLLAPARGHDVLPTAATLLELPPATLSATQRELALAARASSLDFSPQPSAVHARRFHQRSDCRLAILFNPDESEPPSNPRALERFLSAAATLGMQAELITQHDASRLGEFDALFIRETTALWNHTYALACRAARLGLFVVDDADSIRHCCNKIFLGELLARHGVATPRTLALHRGNVAEVVRELGLPCVLKQPDGWSSRGMLLVHSEKELREGMEELMEKGALLLAQEFVPTGFDWRIGVFGGQPIYASKYYMVPDHWQVVRRSRDGVRLAEGPDEPVDLQRVPPLILELATRAAELIGDGLYGVDLKEVPVKAESGGGTRSLVIEVNDNPSVDAGIEDSLLEDELYLRIMRGFLGRILSGRSS